MKRPHMKTAVFKAPEPLLRALRAVAKQMDVSFSKLVRQQMTRLLEEWRSGDKEDAA